MLLAIGIRVATIGFMATVRRDVEPLAIGGVLPQMAFILVV